MKIKISTKFILVAVIIVLVVSTTMGWVAYHVGRDFLRQRISAQLNSLAQARAAHIRGFLQHTRESVRIITTSRVLRAGLKNLDADGSDKTFIIRDINQRLNRFLVESHIRNIFIVGTNGMIIASTDPKYIGLDRSNDAYFTGGQKDLFIKDAYISRTTGQEGLAVSAPMLDYKTGNLLGVIVVRVSLDAVNVILNDQTCLGETGETYLANKNGFMISQARLAGKDTFLTLKVDTQNSRECFADMASIQRGALEKKHPHTSKVFRDYRGIKVLGCHAHIPEMDWCLLAEINVHEAFAPVRRLRAIIFLFGIIFAMITIVIVWLVVRHVARPINDLNEGVKRIGAGDLQHRVNIHTGDEIEQLADQFNRMAGKLADSYALLEQKVAERTQHLEHAIDARKKAEESLVFQTTLLEAQKETTLDGILVVDDNGKIISFNQRFLELWRMPKKILSTKSDNKLLDFILSQLKYPNRFLAEVNYLYAHKSLKRRDEILFKDGRVFDRYSSPLITSHGKHLGRVWFFNDITERKKTEKIKTEFISTVSHELRTPLTSIRGSLGLMAGGATGDLPEKSRELLDIARRNCDRLIMIVNDILDIEKIESGKIEFNLQPLDIMPLVGQALQANQSYADQYGVKYVLQETLPEGKVYVDENRLMQVMTNLLSNATKFSPENETVVISVTRRDKFIRVAVKDNGPGIPEEFHNRVFERFAQADSSDTRPKEGTGLGLSVAKKLIERMQGTIGFESQPGQGATFFFEIPE